MYPVLREGGRGDRGMGSTLVRKRGPRAMRACGAGRRGRPAGAGTAEPGNPEGHRMPVHGWRLPMGKGHARRAQPCAPLPSSWPPPAAHTARCRPLMSACALPAGLSLQPAEPPTCPASRGCWTGPR